MKSSVRQPQRCPAERCWGDPRTRCRSSSSQRQRYPHYCVYAGAFSADPPLATSTWTDPADKRTTGWSWPRWSWFKKSHVKEICIKTLIQSRASPELSCNTVSMKLSEKERDRSPRQLQSERAIPPLELSPSLALSSLSLILWGMMESSLWNGGAFPETGRGVPTNKWFGRTAGLVVFD